MGGALASRRDQDAPTTDLFAAERQCVTARLAALSLIALACTLTAVRLRWRNLGLPMMALAPALLLAGAAVALLDTPTQQGLWAVLVAGVAGLGAMVWKLARDASGRTGVKPGPGPASDATIGE